MSSGGGQRRNITTLRLMMNNDNICVNIILLCFRGHVNNIKGYNYIHWEKYRNKTYASVDNVCYNNE